MATFPGLDSRFIIDLSLQQPFRDKDTGLPLRNGTLTFYDDCNRTTPKSVYKLSGGPSSYIYTDVGNVITLNSAGYPTDTIYYFPYDGDPDTSEGDIVLYYVEVKNESGVTQQNREAIPNLVKESAESTNLENFIPNGQFRANKTIGDITSVEETCVAYGPWYWVQDSTSSATDNVSFNNLGITNDPERYPRYECVVQSITPDGGDLVKDLRIRFKDVNKFASTTDVFTFKFSGRSKTGANVSVEAFAVYNLGTGGSPSTRIEKSIKSSTDLTPSWTTVEGSFTFDVNDGETLGTNNDDYVEIAIRFPTDGAFTAGITDCVLALGDLTDVEYPYITDEQDSSVYLGGSLPYPDPDGANLYLPTRLGPCGLEYDDSMVSDVIYKTRHLYLEPNEIVCDGTSYFDNQTKNGIPLSRCGQKLRLDSGTEPRFGTGRQFVNPYVTAGNLDYVYLATNFKGSTTLAAAGTSGFTVAAAHTGADYACESYRTSAITNHVYIHDLAFGAAATPPSAGTSGFTITVLRQGNTNVRELIRVDTISAAAMVSGGKYFLWSNTTTNYYVWFTIDGLGSDPAPGGIGIKINLLSTDSSSEVAVKLFKAMNGYQLTQILCTSGATLDGKYFTFSTYVPTDYYVWYNVDGGSTDPAQSGTGIEVAIASTDTATQVAAATVSALNMFAWCPPDLRGRFIRIYNNGSGFDPEASNRYMLWREDNDGDNIGTTQIDEYSEHNHPFSYSAVLAEGTFSAVGTLITGINGDTSLPNNISVNSGGKETRPENIYLNAVMKI